MHFQSIMETKTQRLVHAIKLGVGLRRTARSGRSQHLGGSSHCNGARRRWRECVRLCAHSEDAGVNRLNSARIHHKSSTFAVAIHAMSYRMHIRTLQRMGEPRDSSSHCIIIGIRAGQVPFEQKQNAAQVMHTMCKLHKCASCRVSTYHTSIKTTNAS